MKPEKPFRRWSLPDSIRISKVLRVIAVAGYLLFSSIGTWAQTPDLQADSFNLPDKPKPTKQAEADWANLACYRSENAALSAPKENEQRVVFMGDSLTDYWGRREGEFFPTKPYVNRGISGQTTGQILARFKADVLQLMPKIVIVLGGSNDMRLGLPDSEIKHNLMEMAELAHTHRIKVILGSVTPVCDCFTVKSDTRPAARIIALNEWIRGYCKRSGSIYVDYFHSLADAEGHLRRELTTDGVHLNAKGYGIITPLAQNAIAAAAKSTQ